MKIRNINKKAFTLAEVLVTLVVIGIVAALTIPTVVAKYQKQVYYTEFMKVYNTLQNAMNMSVMEYGAFNTWQTTTKAEKQTAFDQYIKPYLKVSYVCDSDMSNCVDSSVLINALNYNYNGLYKDFFSSTGNFKIKSVILSDGALVQFEMYDGYVFIWLDTNGVKKPNIAGRDIFYLYYGRVNGQYRLTAPELQHAESIDVILDDMENGKLDENCTTNNESIGYGCAARLLLERKMNY